MFVIQCRVSVVNKERWRWVFSVSKLGEVLNQEWFADEVCICEYWKRPFVQAYLLRLWMCFVTDLSAFMYEYIHLYLIHTHALTSVRNIYVYIPYLFA
jgi:hypothetical protein